MDNPTTELAAPLTRTQMSNAIERCGGDMPRVPLGWVKFYNHGTIEKYGQLVAHCHSLGMHFWFHTDGAIEPILDDLGAIGMDTLHPMQEPPMDLLTLAEKYRGKFTFHVGIDIQYLLPTGTREEVIEGTKRLIDLCDHPEGGCVLAASNGIMPETPLENIEAFLQTAVSYGQEKRHTR